jgi:hypothetical protein
LFDYFSKDNKGWDLVAEAQLEADEAMNDLADNIYFNNPENRVGKQN